jgi:hypothetical protein
MNRYVTMIALLLLSLFSVPHASAQDDVCVPRSEKSLADRIAVARFVGLSIDEKLGGYTLYQNTMEQHHRNLTALADYRVAIKNHEEKLRKLDSEYQEVQERGEEQLRAAPTNDLAARVNSIQEERDIMQARAKERNAITLAKNQLNISRPSTPFLNQIILYDVILIGPDYLELQKSEDPQSTILVPFNKICRIITPSKTTGINPSVEPADSSTDADSNTSDQVQRQ